MKIKTRLGKIILLAAMLTVSVLQGVSANTVSVGITTYITETGEKGYGCTSIEKHYASPTDVSIEPAQSVPGTEETALKLGMGAGGIAALYSSLAQVAESMVPYTSVSFDMYSQSNDVSFAFSYDDANAGNIINSVAISDYAKDEGTFKSVNIPLSAFGKTVGISQGTYDWKWQNGIYMQIRNGAEAADVYIKNLVISQSYDTVGDYSYDEAGTIALVKDGVYVNGMKCSVSSQIYAVEGVVSDGKAGVYFEFPTTGRFMVFGSPSEKPFANVTSTADYNLVCTVKFEEAHPYPLSFAVSHDFWDWGGAAETVAIGSKFEVTSDWQTLEIPLDELVATDISDKYGLGFKISGVKDALTGANGSYLPKIYVNEFKLVPKTSVKTNALKKEKCIKEIPLFVNGKNYNGDVELEKDCAIYPKGDSNPTLLIRGSYDYHNYSHWNEKVLQYTGNAYRGISFDISGCGITDDNYKNKYLSFYVTNQDNGADRLLVYRDKGFGMQDGEYESRSIMYDPTPYKPNKIIVPLESITNNPEISWNDTKCIAIVIEKTINMYKFSDYENVKICEFAEGGVTESGAELKIEGTSAYAEIAVQNTMNSAYNYKNGNINIIAAKDLETDKLIDAVTVDCNDSVVQANSVASLKTNALDLMKIENFANIYFYQWDKDYAPVAGVTDDMYIAE